MSSDGWQKWRELAKLSAIQTASTAVVVAVANRLSDEDATWINTAMTAGTLAGGALIAGLPGGLFATYLADRNQTTGAPLSDHL